MGSVLGKFYKSNANRTAEERINEKFLDAVEANDIVKVKKYLAKGAAIESKNECGDTAVHRALILGYFDLFQMLIVQYGADVNVNDSAGTSLIELACVHHYFNSVKLLSEYGADANRSMADGNKLLHYAILQNCELTCENLLVAPHIDVNAREANFGQTPLHFACMCSNLEIVQMLCKRNDINLNALDCNNSSALHVASKKAENLPIVEFLVDSGCDINLTDSRKYSALDIACEHDSLAIVKWLLSTQNTNKSCHQFTVDYLLAHNLFPITFTNCVTTKNC